MKPAYLEDDQVLIAADMSHVPPRIKQDDAADRAWMNENDSANDTAWIRGVHDQPAPRVGILRRAWRWWTKVTTPRSGPVDLRVGLPAPHPIEPGQYNSKWSAQEYDAWKAVKREYYHNPGNPDVERALMRSNSVDISEAWRQPSHDHHRLTPRGEARSLMRELAGIGSEFWVAKPCEYVSGGCAVTEYVIRVAVRRGPG